MSIDTGRLPSRESTSTTWSADTDPTEYCQTGCPLLSSNVASGVVCPYRAIEESKQTPQGFSDAVGLSLVGQIGNNLVGRCVELVQAGGTPLAMLQDNPNASRRMI